VNQKRIGEKNSKKKEWDHPLARNVHPQKVGQLVPKNQHYRLFGVMIIPKGSYHL
jgi:hypothetical protein